MTLVSSVGVTVSCCHPLLTPNSEFSWCHLFGDTNCQQWVCVCANGLFNLLVSLIDDTGGTLWLVSLIGDMN